MARFPKVRIDVSMAVGIGLRRLLNTFANESCAILEVSYRRQFFNLRVFALVEIRSARIYGNPKQGNRAFSALARSSPRTYPSSLVIDIGTRGPRELVRKIFTIINNPQILNSSKSGLPSLLSIP